jgi:dCMP deaminase
MTDKELKKARKYLDLARYNAELFSKDPHTKVGCILLTNDFSRVLVTGINGMVRKMDDNNYERWKRPTKYSYVSHSEANAIANAARTGTILEGSIAVITKFPCSTCTKLLIQAGITKIYTVSPDYSSTTWGDDAKISEEMLGEVGIEIIKLDILNTSFEERDANMVKKNDIIKINDNEFKAIDVSFGGGGGGRGTGKVHIIAIHVSTNEKIELLLKDTDIICMKKMVNDDANLFEHCHNWLCKANGKCDQLGKCSLNI